MAAASGAATGRRWLTKLGLGTIEGIKAFGERPFEALPKDSTFFLCLETLGASHLLALFDTVQRAILISQEAVRRLGDESL